MYAFPSTIRDDIRRRRPPLASYLLTVLYNACVADGRSIRLILAPYDAGHRAFRMGVGPEHLLANGLEEALRQSQRGVRTVVVECESAPPVEVASAFELDRLVSEEVRHTVEAEEFPLVLSGNCNTSVGTVAGLGSGEDLGVVWFDAHPDFDTPETTTTGFTDSMGLSIMTGHCWKKMAEGVPGFAPVDEANVVLVGTRAASLGEQKRLASFRLKVVANPAEENDLLGMIKHGLDRLSSHAQRVYVHLDLDVLDTGKVGCANEFAVPGGLTQKDLEDAILAVRERFSVAAAGVASYDPSFDREGKILHAALACAESIVAP